MPAVRVPSPSLLTHLLAVWRSQRSVACVGVNKGVSSSMLVCGYATRASADGRRRLVILGTGWSSYSVLRHIDKELYDVTVISPRNHFLFTPLLASTAVGTLEFRSIIEPVRNTGFRNEHDFHLSKAMDIDQEEKAVSCVSVLDPSLSYRVPYDVLVIGVGADPNTFDIPGVQEHAYFLKVSQ